MPRGIITCSNVYAILIDVARGGLCDLFNVHSTIRTCYNSRTLQLIKIHNVCVKSRQRKIVELAITALCVSDVTDCGYMDLLLSLEYYHYVTSDNTFR